MQFIVDYGMLQARDINPAADGVTTADLTNPRLETDEKTKQAEITGQNVRNTSPILFVLIAAIVLFLIGLLQK